MNALNFCKKGLLAWGHCQWQLECYGLCWEKQETKHEELAPVVGGGREASEAWEVRF